MDLKAGQELPGERQDKGVPGEAKATGKGTEAGIDTVWGVWGQTLDLACLGRQWP